MYGNASALWIEQWPTATLENADIRPVRQLTDQPCVRLGSGTVVQVGNLSSGPISFSANAIMAKEVDLKGSYRFGDEFKLAVELISKGAIDVERIITARLPLTDAPDAFLLAIDRERNVKVVLTAD